MCKRDYEFFSYAKKCRTSFPTTLINVYGAERTVVVNCEPYPESLIHHGRHKTKSGGFSNSSDNVLSVFVYLFDKHISLIDTCLSYIYCYYLGPVKNWSYNFLHTKKNHNPSNTPKPWPVCILLLSDDWRNCIFYILKSLKPNTNMSDTSEKIALSITYLCQV